VVEKKKMMMKTLVIKKVLQHWKRSNHGYNESLQLDSHKRTRGGEERIEIF